MQSRFHMWASSLYLFNCTSSYHNVDLLVKQSQGSSLAFSGLVLSPLSSPRLANDNPDLLFGLPGEVMSYVDHIEQRYGKFSFTRVVKAVSLLRAVYDDKKPVSCGPLAIPASLSSLFRVVSTKHVEWAKGFLEEIDRDDLLFKAIDRGNIMKNMLEDINRILDKAEDKVDRYILKCMEGVRIILTVTYRMVVRGYNRNRLSKFADYCHTTRFAIQRNRVKPGSFLYARGIVDSMVALIREVRTNVVKAAEQSTPSALLTEILEAQTRFLRILDMLKAMSLACVNNPALLILQGCSELVHTDKLGFAVDEIGEHSAIPDTEFVIDTAYAALLFLNGSVHKFKSYWGQMEDVLLLERRIKMKPRPIKTENAKKGLRSNMNNFGKMLFLLANFESIFPPDSGLYPVVLSERLTRLKELLDGLVADTPLSKGIQCEVDEQQAWWGKVSEAIDRSGVTRSYKAFVARYITNYPDIVYLNILRPGPGNPHRLFASYAYKVVYHINRIVSAGKQVQNVIETLKLKGKTNKSRRVCNFRGYRRSPLKRVLKRKLRKNKKQNETPYRWKTSKYHEIHESISPVYLNVYDKGIYTHDYHKDYLSKFIADPYWDPDTNDMSASVVYYTMKSSQLSRLAQHLKTNYHEVQTGVGRILDESQLREEFQASCARIFDHFYAFFDSHFADKEQREQGRRIFYSKNLRRTGRCMLGKTKLGVYTNCVTLSTEYRIEDKFLNCLNILLHNFAFIIYSMSAKLAQLQRSTAHLEKISARKKWGRLERKWIKQGLNMATLANIAVITKMYMALKGIRNVLAAVQISVRLTFDKELADAFKTLDASLEGEFSGRGMEVFNTLLFQRI